jgi:hypothetical protein
MQAWIVCGKFALYRSVEAMIWHKKKDKEVNPVRKDRTR